MLLPPAVPVSHVSDDEDPDPHRETDPTVVRSLAVRTDDVVAALEANERRDAGAVLRVTPPFSGRMRARLHRERDADPPEPLCVPPDRFVDAESLPAYPTPDGTEDAIRVDPEVTYSPEVHRRRHEAAVERWRAAVRDAIVDRAIVETGEGSHEVRVRTLG